MEWDSDNIAKRALSFLYTSDTDHSIAFDAIKSLRSFSIEELVKHASNSTSETNDNLNKIHMVLSELFYCDFVRISPSSNEFVYSATDSFLRNYSAIQKSLRNSGGDALFQ